MSATRHYPKDAPDGYRWCAGHEEYEPIDRFGFKNKTRGTRQSYCREYQRQYTALYHQRTRRSANPAIHARNRARIDEARLRVGRFLATSSCNNCDATTNLVVATGSDQPMLSRMIANGWAWERIEVFLVPGRVLCVSCLRRYADAAIDTSPTE